MDYKQLIDPELRKSARRFPFNEGVVIGGNLYQSVEWDLIKPYGHTEEKEIVITGYMGLPVRVSVFSPKGVGDRLPALLYVHGGAFVYKAAGYQKKLALIYAKKAGCRVFFPHYHLAPKYRYPAAYEDVLAVYRFVESNAGKFGIDPDRIGVAGDSAGASIAELLCNRWKKENIKMPCLQMLAYPVTDARMDTDSMKKYTDTPQWDAKANEKMWSFYCGDDPKLRKSASPMNSPIPGAMPKTYIESAQFDCLHDEGVLYAEKLRLAGVDVKTVETKGTFHGYDTALKTQIVRKHVKNRISFLKEAFGK